MIDDCAYEEKERTLNKKLVLLEFNFKILKLYYLIVGQEDMGKNFVDDIR